MKRFWTNAEVVEAGGGWQVALDGRAVRTRGGAPQVVPSRALGELLRAEWAAAPEEFGPAHFPARDLADRAIDKLADDCESVIARLLGFAEGDTLCYRAEPDEPLGRRQAEVWEPIVAGVESALGVAFVRTNGIIHRPQGAETLRAIRSRLEGESVFVLAALDAAASLAASLCVALAGIGEKADPEALWDAASLEEDWQAERWGRDPEAAARRDAMGAEFVLALAFARAARAD